MRQRLTHGCLVLGMRLMERRRSAVPTSSSAGGKEGGAWLGLKI